MTSNQNVPVTAGRETTHTSLLELALLFGKLGATAFGGPAVHIALLEEEVVTRRGWLTREEFLDFLGATNLIPGPNSTEMAIHIGRVRRGWPGLLVAGISFILPAALMVGCLAWTYVRFGSIPEIAGVMYGVKPVVIAVIAQAAWRLGRTAVRSRWLAVLGAAAAVAAGFGIDALLVLGLAAVAAAVRHRVRSTRRPNAAIGVVAASWPVWAPASPSLGWLFLVMLKIGATILGGGYVLVAFLRSDLIIRLHWLTEQQLLDAVAMGQITPGPLFTTATFVGYLVGRAPGAPLATVGIFLPAFVLVAASGPLIPKLRQSPWTADVLDGVNVSALALMAVVSLQLARSAVVDWQTAAIAAISAALLIRYRVNSAWLILSGALIGLGLQVTLSPGTH
jgi:chromate transporter